MSPIVARIAPVVILAIALGLASWIAIVPPPIPPIPPGAVFRDCPVADCSAYPVPSRVRGITISSLQGYLTYPKAAEAQIRAAKAWHANDIRLQVEQDKLVGANGNWFNPWYAAATRQIVGYALRQGFYVTLNAQTEETVGYGRNEPLPTKATEAFWRYFTGLYGTFPHVIFDLFNEPRNCSWGQWQNGGGGYVGFQQLVSYIRSQGSLNQLWVEGRAWASTLQGMPLLTGQGVVYSFHHPGAPHQYQAPMVKSTWWQAFGSIAAKGVPVVDGEFVNFTGGYVWTYATRRVTEYLELLHQWHIGVVAWSLQPGVMTAGMHLTVPAHEPLSAGALVWDDFHGTLGRPVLAAGEGVLPMYRPQRSLVPVTVAAP